MSRPRARSLSVRLSIVVRLVRASLPIVMLLVWAPGCGGKSELTIDVRDEENKPVAGVEIRQVGSEKVLGKTASDGRVSVQPSRSGGDVQIRVSSAAGDEGAAPRFEFDNPYAVDDAAFRRSTYFIRAKAPAASPSDSTATLLVETDPPGAEVSIDGAARGATPASVGGLTPGRAQLELRLSGWHPHAMVVFLEPGENRYSQTLTREEVTTASLQVFSEPSGAEVWLNDRRTDRVTPARFEDLPSGSYRVKVAKGGFQAYETKVTLEPGSDGISDAGPLALANAAAPKPKPPSGTGGTVAPSAGSSATKPAASGAGRTYKVSAYPGWAEVYVDDESANRNEMGNFKVTLGEGVHHFRVVNAPIGVNIVLKYDVKPGDANTKLILNYEKRAVDARP